MQDYPSISSRQGRLPGSLIGTTQADHSEEPTYKLACMEVWGGNRKTIQSVELPGLSGWVYSKPFEASAGGGDLHYLSVCNHGILSRIALADVSGHGMGVDSVALKLRGLIREYINTWDQSALMRDINNVFREDEAEGSYATASIFGFYLQFSCLAFTNAGHLPPLWYHASGRRWELLQEPSSPPGEIQGLPLGLIAGTGYRQSAVKIDPDDILVLYTDGITETVNQSGDELTAEGLLRLVESCPVGSPVATGKALLNAVREFQFGMPDNDDQTMIVLHRTGTMA
ncbi:MAG TPA: PP2C family protein-serine/threonine phosphatase [Terriglobia bacterium]|nr:PP2C family protein-serine/threonine phosphatase [Terriglobia bacterium]